MPDLNDKISKLKGEGLSLRRIAATLNMSHEAVRKRLKNLEGKGNVSTIETERKLTASTIQNEKVSTAPNAHQSRASEESESIVNLIPSVETPSHTLTEDVNPLETPPERPTGGMKGAFQRVDPDDGDLLSSIRDFLAVRGVEMYRMKTPAYEGYQIEDGGQVIRFYVQRKQSKASKVPREG